MNKFLLTTATIIGFAGTATAADLPKYRPLIVPEYTQNTYTPINFSMSGGIIYSTKDRSTYGVLKPSVEYNNFVGFAEYGYAKKDKQFVSGGVGYNISYNDFYATPQIKAGYHWGNGAFISPGMNVGYKVNQNVSLEINYNFVQYRKTSDNQFGGGLKITF